MCHIYQNSNDKNSNFQIKDWGKTIDNNNLLYTYMS